MKVLAVLLLVSLAYLLAYNIYGRWLARCIFRLRNDRPCPSKQLYDGIDYVPTPKEVVFGHHFSSIAGTGPIVGPAIAVFWGWLPALLWVVVGAIFIGAVHDLGSLVVSLRHRGQTIGDVAGRLLNKRIRLAFLLVLLLLLTTVLAVFALVIASVFRQFPAAIFPWFVQIPLAIAVGLWLHQGRGRLFVLSAMVLALMYVSVFYGDREPLRQFNQYLANMPVIVWAVFLLVYSFVASVLPVWLLLQPRDYINGLQLTSALGLIALGVAISCIFGWPGPDGMRHAVDFVGPAVQWRVAGAPDIIPFLFITVACGAVSGFHCLVSSGTSSKQLEKETDAQFVGYGAMLLEGFLATLVILACTAGLGLGYKGTDGRWISGEEAWAARYISWAAADALAAKISAFVIGAGNFLRSLGIPQQTSVGLMGVLVASFAATTMDTACRLERYVIEELVRVSEWRAARGMMRRLVELVGSRYGAALIAVVFAAALASVPPPGEQWSIASAGKGGLLLWPLFGATNQLLGGLAFLVIFSYLWRRRRPVFFLILPAIWMLIIPFWAMFVQVFIGSGAQPGWLAEGRWLLVLLGIAAMVLEVWMVVEGIRLIPKIYGVLEEEAAEHEAAQEIEPAIGMGC